MCDFILISASAVSEFSLWVAPHLWDHHLDLQATDRFTEQSMPLWTRHVPGATASRRRPAVAHAFCTALAEACGNETRRLYGGRWCMRCDHSA